MIDGRNALRPYNDTPPDPDNLGGMLANAAHGHKADPFLDALKAEFEGTNTAEINAATTTDTFN